jgi:hypothetical protein
VARLANNSVIGGNLLGAVPLHNQVIDEADQSADVFASYAAAIFALLLAH